MNPFFEVELRHAHLHLRWINSRQCPLHHLHVSCTKNTGTRSPAFCRTKCLTLYNKGNSTDGYSNGHSERYISERPGSPNRAPVFQRTIMDRVTSQCNIFHMHIRAIAQTSIMHAGIYRMLFLFIGIHGHSAWNQSISKLRNCWCDSTSDVVPTVGSRTLFRTIFTTGQEAGARVLTLFCTTNVGVARLKTHL